MCMAFLLKRCKGGIRKVTLKPLLLHGKGCPSCPEHQVSQLDQATLRDVEAVLARCFPMPMLVVLRARSLAVVCAWAPEWENYITCGQGRRKTAGVAVSSGAPLITELFTNKFSRNFHIHGAQGSVTPLFPSSWRPCVDRMLVMSQPKCKQY